MIYTGMLFEYMVSFYAVNSTDMVEEARKDHDFSPVVSSAVG